MANLLSDNAVREIRQIGLEVKALKQKFGTIPTRPNQRRYQIFAEIDSYIADGTYTADEVIADSNGILGTTPGNPIRWDNDSTGVGYLYAVDDTSGDATGIFPVFPYSDGEDTFWGFKTHPPDEDLQHPFKVRGLGGSVFEIGSDRGESFRVVRDIINIYDRDGSKLYTIEKTEPEQLSILSDSYIYYRISRTVGGEWTADALSTTIWPPTGADTDQDKLYAPIAFIKGTTGIGQIQFSTINVNVRQFQPSFAAHAYNNGVTITAGNVHTPFGTTTVAGANVPNGSDAWVEVVTAPDGEPAVNATVQVGTFPGYQAVAGGTLTRRHRLGYFALGDVWIPTHEGDVWIGTEYQPNVPAIAQATGAQSYQVPAGTVTNVGADKELFFDGATLGVEVLGGEHKKITTVVAATKLGGVSADTEQVILTGAAKVGSNLVITNITRSLDIEKGLGQVLTDVANTDITIPLGDPTAITITEGPGIDATLVGANYTITSLLADADGVSVVQGAAGAAHTVKANYPEIWAHVLAGANITLNKVGDNMTISAEAVGAYDEGPGIDITGQVITSLLDDDGDGVVVTQGAAGADHIVSLDYAAIWGHLREGSGIQLSIDIATGDYTIDSMLNGSQSITVTQGLAGEAHTVEVHHQMSVTSDAYGVKLVNDDETPTAFSVYGYTSGVAATYKKWHDILSFFNDTDSIKRAGGSGEIVSFDLNAAQSIAVDSGGVHLQGDELDPGAYSVYGCGSAGDNDAKDWLTTTEVTVITDMQLDASNDLQIKTRTMRVLVPADESSFSTVTGWDTTDCDAASGQTIDGGTSQ